MSEDSPDHEIWNRRTNELIQKLRISGDTESVVIERKDAFFYSQPPSTPRKELSKNKISSTKTTRTKQNNVKSTRPTSTTNTPTLFSFFSPKITSNETIENNKSINITIEREKSLSKNTIKRIKCDTESMIKVEKEILTVKRRSIQSRYWNSIEENQHSKETYLNEEKDNKDKKPLYREEDQKMKSTPDESNIHVNNCLDSSSKLSITKEENIQIKNISSSLPLESFSSNAEVIKESFRYSIDEKESRSILDVESKEIESIVVEKQAKSQSRKECPWYKKLPGTSITMDAFRYGKIPHCTAYFLSHFHSDHYGGLTSKWSHGLIYCSTVTGNLVIQQLKVARHFVRKLPMNEEVCIDNNNGITVTLIDANHCPGSAIFLFKFKNENGQIKRYLHTGDFRACPRQVLHSAITQPQNLVVDILYLDTTYLNPQYFFPAQEVVINAMIKLVCKTVKRGELIPMKRNNGNNCQGKNKQLQSNKSQLALDKWFKKIPEILNPEQSEIETKVMDTEESNSYMKKVDFSDDESIDIDELELKDSKILIVIGTYLIGKEKVFFGIAKALRTKIYVTCEKRKMLMCQEISGLESLLTDDPHQAYVHVVSLTSIKSDSLCAYLESLQPSFKSVMAFRPTGWTYKPTEGQRFSTSSTTEEILNASTLFTVDSIRPTFSTPTCQIFGVPYSEHSSFRELAAFVMSLNVKQIIPTVNIGSEKSRENMKYWLDKWQKEKNKKDIKVVQYDVLDHW
ncbi:14516_t:CDS:2 [Funneliformis geosporum]|uniref:10426_t:CDS:1 n=1 Tax=Funneliformis geosporum TaxID=1117311 RepID=A0A9W4SMM9_9GLOM|nr:14516_t:CDS:2 [Funneliformis geosporum]CAI2172554.1 10426_t:CDS:2 [Funneliformis geosporum]